jgi:hypothetical protein
VRSSFTALVLATFLGSGFAAAQGPVAHGFSVGLLPLSATGHVVYAGALGDGPCGPMPASRTRSTAASSRGRRSPSA